MNTGTLSVDALINMKDTHQPKGGFLNRFVLKDGESKFFRMVPSGYGPNSNVPFVPITHHWLQPALDKPMLCPNHHSVEGQIASDACPACKLRTELYAEEKELSKIEKTMDPNDPKAAEFKVHRKYVELMINALRPGTRFFTVGVDRTQDGQLVEYGMPKTVFERVVAEIQENGMELIDPEEGHDFKISRKKEKTRVSYDVSVALKSSPLSESAATRDDILSKADELPLNRHLEVGVDADEIAGALEEFKAATRREAETKVGSEVSQQSSGASAVAGWSAPAAAPQTEAAPATNTPAVAQTPSFNPTPVASNDTDEIPMDFKAGDKEAADSAALMNKLSDLD